VFSPKEKERDKHACVCCCYFANPSTVSVCLSVCTCTSVCPDACIYNPEVLCMCNKHSSDLRSNSCHIHSTYTHSHTFSDFTQVKSLNVCECVYVRTVLCKQPREKRTLTQAMKARQKRRLAGPTTGCCPNKASCIDEKQRVRPPAARTTQKKRNV
jgi:hypothetical protein